MAKTITIRAASEGAAALRRLREAAGFTQRGLAADVGMDQAQLSRLEASADLRLSTLVSLADRLGYEVQLTPGKDRPDGRLAELVAEAVRAHRATAFWNTPTDLPLPEMAAVAVAKLRKYGGRSGWFLAAQIARELEAAHAD